MRGSHSVHSLAPPLLLYAFAHALHRWGWRVVATEGDAALGLSELDHSLLPLLLGQALRAVANAAGAVDLRSARSRLSLHFAAGRLRESLINGCELAATTASFACDDGDDVSVELRVTSGEFEALLAPLVRPLEALVDSALRTARIDVDAPPSRVFLCGTLPPTLRAKGIADRFRSSQLVAVAPGSAVRGAAAIAAARTGMGAAAALASLVSGSATGKGSQWCETVDWQPGAVAIELPAKRRAPLFARGADGARSETVTLRASHSEQTVRLLEGEPPSQLLSITVDAVAPSLLTRMYLAAKGALRPPYSRGARLTRPRPPQAHRLWSDGSRSRSRRRVPRT